MITVRSTPLPAARLRFKPKRRWAAIHPVFASYRVNAASEGLTVTTDQLMARAMSSVMVGAQDRELQRIVVRVAAGQLYQAMGMCPDCWQASCPWHAGWWIDDPFLGLP